MKLINNKLISKNKLKAILGLMTAIFLLSGCAAGFLNISTYDPKTGKTTKTAYSPLFSTDSTPLARGAEFRVSVVITRRVEPVSYTLLSSMGGLTPDDLISKATAVVHFKNDSQRIYRINLKKLIMLNQDFPIKAQETILRPGGRFNTKPTLVKAPTYDTTFSLKLFYELDGKFFEQKFFMKRQKIEDLKRK